MGIFIIDLTQRPDDTGKQKDRFAKQYRDIGNSGIEINGDGEARREEIDFGEIAHGYQLEIGKLGPGENQIQAGGQL